MIYEWRLYYSVEMYLNTKPNEVASLSIEIFVGQFRWFTSSDSNIDFFVCYRININSSNLGLVLKVFLSCKPTIKVQINIFTIEYKVRTVKLSRPCKKISYTSYLLERDHCIDQDCHYINLKLYIVVY